MQRVRLLHSLILANDIPGLKDLIETGHNVNEADSEGFTALHYSVKQGNYRAVCYLLQQRRCNVNCVSGVPGVNDSSDKLTPLHLAASYGNTEIVTVLLKCGARVDPLDRSERTPLFLATCKCHIKAAKVLISYGANVNAKDIHGYSSLQQSLSHKQYALTRALLASGALVTAYDLITTIRTKRYKVTHLLLDVMESGDPQLNGTGTDLNYAMTPLLMLIYGFDTGDDRQLDQVVDLLKKFISKGVDVNCKSRHFQSVFHTFMRNRDDCDEDPKLKELFKLLLSCPDIDVDLKGDSIDNSPLSLAIATSNFYFGEMLLRRGADVSRCDLSELMYSFRAENFMKLLYLSGFKFPFPHFVDAFKPGSSLLMRPGDDLALHEESFERLVSWLKVRMSVGLSLKEMTRIALRRRYCNQIDFVVTYMAIPDTLKSYLTFTI